MQQAFNKKFAITLAGLSVISILLFTMCDNERNNPLDAHASNFVPPSITIDTIGTNIGDGDTISTDSAKITVTGNRSECIFQASMDSVNWAPWQSSGEFVFDLLSPGRHTVTIETKYDGFDVVVAKAITFFVQSPKSSSKALTSFSFAKLAAAGEITESVRTVVVKVPYETDVTVLVATFVATGATVKVGSKTQVSDTTPNNFSTPVIYRVIAADSSYQDYTVKVEVGSNKAKAITAFSFTNSTATTIDTAAKTIVVSVPYNTIVKALVPTISHSGASISPASSVAQNFSDSVMYTVTAADGSTQVYHITVIVGLNSSKAITAFSFTNSTSTTIDTAAKTIVVSVPYNTIVKALVPAITHSGTSISPASSVAQNFSDSVMYTVTAADGSTQVYHITVTVGLNASKAITVFSFNNSTSTTIDTAAKTIVVSVPYNTIVKALVPTITHSGASISPASGVAQDFTDSVIYTVKAADGSIQTYHITVTVGLNSAKAITAFSFNNSTSTTIDTAAKTIVVNLPHNTVVKALIPTITYSGASISPASGVAQDFTDSVTYTVTASDGSTQAYHIIVALGLDTSKAITAFSFTNSTATNIDTAAKKIIVSVPYNTTIKALVPSIAHSGANISPASGVAQDFSGPVTYTVTAADGTTQAYLITVAVSLNTAKAIKAFSFTNSTAMTIDTVEKTIIVSVPYNTTVTALIPTISYSGANLSPASGVAQDFTDLVKYTVTAADGSTQAYLITVAVSLNTANAITTFSFTNSTATTIDTLAKTIVVNVPYNTTVNALVPTISHSGTNISPASGVAQDFSDPVKYTVTAADKTIQTYVVSVTVAPPKPITLLAVLGVAAPVTGATPVSGITETAQYTGTVSWTPAVTTFLGAQSYTATIVLTAKDGYTFEGVAANKFTVAGSSTAIYSINTGVVTAQFPATAAAVINIGTIPGVVAPVSGAVPVTSAIDNSQYSGSIVWSPANNTFAAATVYTANILLSAKVGYTFEGVAANFFTVTGATSTTNPVNSRVVTAVFPATAMLTMVSVPGGTFQRDSVSANASTVSAFRMSTHEITREQFLSIMGTDPSNAGFSSGMSAPVQNVNWYHALAFCNKLSIAEGLSPVYSINGSANPDAWGIVPTSSNTTWDAAISTRTNTGYRLPTEMEWMWAAMGATAGITGYLKAFAGSNGSNAIGDYAWTWENSSGNNKSQPVGTKQPNELYLFDMSGSVWELCGDWYNTYPEGATNDYTGAATGTDRVVRGGSWYRNVLSSTVACRLNYFPFYQHYSFGFRVVRH